MTTPPDHERWRQIEAILDLALELPAEGVPAFLDRACAGDRELRAQVEELLAADREAGDFLETPAAELASTLMDDLRDEPTLALPGAPAGAGLVGRRIGPYRVLRRLGEGGMGVVYVARDTRLQRIVALKLLPAGWGRDAATRERFVREARTASSFDHPNICTIHDIGESADGRLYMVMAYYPGETLRDTLARGPLGCGEAVELAIQVGRGLARAHEAGITHRDIKPANVVVTERGEAKILDFGIAKMAGDAGLTRPGSSLGTPAYMSPEQARGERIDARTDIWSLGVMLYEMIAGRHPFEGDNPQAQTWAILDRDPEPLTGVRPEVPPAVARVVAKALAKDPARRYQRVEEMVADLEAGTGPRTVPAARVSEGLRRRWPWAAVAALALLLAVAGWLARGPEPGAAPASPVAQAEVPAVGVLPFVNRTGDPELDWVGEGLARLVRDALASSRHLQVASALRIEPLTAAGGDAGRSRRAAEMGIGVLLSGEILPGPEGLSLAARLEESGGGRQLAARRFDGLAPRELLQTADDIAREAKKGLGVPPTEAVDVFAADFAAGNPGAYELYIEGLRALELYHYGEAEKAFAAALEEAPGFVMARYRLAQLEAATSRTDEALAEIRRAVAEAGRLPDREARYVRAAEAFIGQRYDEAIAAYRELTERYPYETEARYLLATVLKQARRPEETLGQTEILARLEPENRLIWMLAGEAHLMRNQIFQAVVDFERFLELAPESAVGHSYVGDAYRAQGELDLAAEMYSRALELDPAFDFATVSLAVVDVLRGDRRVAEEALAALVADPGATPRQRLDAAFELAWLLRSEGRFRRAAEVLASLEDLLVRERVREALALSVRGTCSMELGDTEEARRLLELAVERSPAAPTRYLFARGLLELREGRWEDLEETVARILDALPPPDEPNRKVEKAAAYLRGRRSLAEGRAGEAVVELTRALTLEGYEYSSYRLDLARAYLAAGKLREAMAAARQASEERDPANPRLDLDLDRARALLVLAQVQEAMGRPREAAAHARELLELWEQADPGLPDLALARRLAAGPGAP